MKQVIIAFIFCFLFTETFSQYQWQSQVSGTTSDLNGVYFTDLNNGWVCGANGTIIHTSNGGSSWSAQSSGTTGTLTHIWFTDNNNGIATGPADYLRTTNGGATWTKPTVVFTGAKSLWFTSSATGWLHSGDSFYKTTNGGNTWSLNASGYNTIMGNLQFSDANNGWTVCQGIYTNDGGVTWNSSFLPAMCDAIRWVWFTDASNGYVVDGDPDGTMGGGFVFKTTNGGGSWTQIQTGLHKFLNCVRFTSASTGWVSGISGALALTQDAGSTWTSFDGLTTNDLFEMFFFDQNNGWVVGAGGTILACKSTLQICIVTVDETMQKNKLIWEKVNGLGIASWNIYRETTPGNYALLGNVPFSGNPEYTDAASQPSVQSNKYKITFLDGSSVESPKSPYHQTINLSVTQGVPVTTMTLIWTRYEDESSEYVPDYYYIYRGTNPSSLALHDSVSGAFNMYNDINVSSIYYYKIEVKKDCGLIDRSGSNSGNNDFNGVNEINSNRNILKLFPNPSEDYIIIEPSEIIPGEDCSVTIKDQTGRIFSDETLRAGSSIRINTGELDAGIYIIEFSGKITQRAVFIKN